MRDPLSALSPSCDSQWPPARSISVEGQNRPGNGAGIALMHDPRSPLLATNLASLTAEIQHLQDKIALFLQIVMRTSQLGLD